MPMNATIEYYLAEKKFQSAKTVEDKILYLEEMIKEIPKHKGVESQLALLKTKLAKLKKEAASASKKKGASRKGVSKEGEAQVCIIGKTMTGKSTILSKLTDARPRISDHPYTTTKPEVGMMDYNGVKIQLVEIPSTFSPEYLSICRSADALVIVANTDEEKKELLKFLESNYIRITCMFIKSDQSVDDIRNRIWTLLGFMLVYTRDRGRLSPMALKQGSKLKDFAFKIHKDFVKNFRFAQIWRKTSRGMRKIQAGLDYNLEDGDAIELHMK
ncbi:MAG: 50S ribosome-binding GTPase [Candidatus Aenigmarchaeota archaeon]|nr:50S ribosome-binding GTPase [Candidatus Aenigmarchaeota archaeon]